MESDPLGDVVSRQYERWMYPAPIFDIPAWLQGNWQWFDPSHAYPLLWPDREYREEMDVLVAGCGTNQAAVIAFTNPTARVVAIDVSEAALGNHRRLAATHSLDNLELKHLPIERVSELQMDFDLIISTGVLHHLDEPEVGMKALAERLKLGGVLAVMLYATYGRLGVQLLQSVFKDLHLSQDESSIVLVKDALAQLDPGHPVHTYVNIASDLGDDAGLVDTFLHGRERTFTINECRDLVTSAGLVFQDLFFKAPYYAPHGSGSQFLDQIAELPAQQQWSIMERLNTRNACHYFLACRPERPVDSYVINFAADRAGKFVPMLRHACRVEHRRICRYNWSLDLDPVRSALVSRIDGRASIDRIVHDIIRDGQLPHLDTIGLTRIALDTVQSLWQLDFLAIRLPSVHDPLLRDKRVRH